MTHKIQSVKPLNDLRLSVLFQNGIEKEFDIHNLYSVLSQFKVFELNSELFNQVQVDVGGYGISWTDDLDLDAEDIWENGEMMKLTRKLKEEGRGGTEISQSRF